MSSQDTPTTLLIGGAIITMNASREVLDPGAIAIRGDRIVAIA